MKSRIAHSMVAAALMTGCGASPSSPPLPTIFEGAQAGNGWTNNGCPPDGRPGELIEGRPEGVSPNVTIRLRAKFPTGTPSSTIEQYLRDIGLKKLSPCSDILVNRMTLETHKFMGGSTIMVSWKSDKLDKMVWIKSYVSHEGL